MYKARIYIFVTGHYLKFHKEQIMVRIRKMTRNDTLIVLIKHAHELKHTRTHVHTHVHTHTRVYIHITQTNPLSNR